MKPQFSILFAVFFLFAGLIYSQESENGEKEQTEMYVIVEGSTDAVLLETEERWSRSLGNLRLDQKVRVLDKDQLEENKALVRVETVIDGDTLTGWVRRTILSDEISKADDTGAEVAGAQAAGQAARGIVVPDPNPIDFDRFKPGEENRADDNLRVRVKGTGQTIGHVLLLEVKNRDKNNPGKIRVTPSLVPGKGKTQAYFITDHIEREVPPGGEITLPLEGVCIDPDKPPLGSGDKGTNFDDWISINPLPDDWEPDPTAGWEPDPGSPLLNPVTESDLNHSIDIVSHPEEIADLIGVYIGRIIDTYDYLSAVGEISTPYTNRPSEERNAIIQQLVWRTAASLSGDEFTQTDWEDRIFDQLPDSGGDLSEEEREEVHSGVDDFWNTATLVGVEAKVLIESEKTGTYLFQDVATSQREAEDSFLSYSKDSQKPPVMSHSDPGCDTVRQKASATLDLSAQMLCEDIEPILEGLDELFGKYATALDELADLKGKDEAVEEFKSDLESMRQEVVLDLQNEVDATKNMKSDDENCGGDWKSNMIDRYGNSASTQRLIDRTERAFERAQNSRIRDLENRLERQENYWDDKIEKLSEMANQSKKAIEDKEKEIEDIRSDLDALINNLIEKVCDFKIIWEDLLTFMEANYQCLDCPQEILEPPPIIQQLNDCLSDLLKGLKGLTKNIPHPGNQGLADRSAEATFDRGDALNKFREVRDAIQEYNDHIASGGGSNVVTAPSECLGPLARSSGYKFFSEVNRPQTSSGDIGRHYGTQGGRTRAGPANPGTMSDQAARREYRAERNEYRAEAARLAREVNRAVRAAKRGVDGQAVEDGFINQENIDAHGKAKAIPYKLENQNQLNDLVDQIIDRVLDCYNQNLAQQHQTRYYELITKCLVFRQCGLAVAKTLAEYAQLLDSLQAQNDSKIDLLRGELDYLKRKKDKLNKQISELNNEINKTKEEIESVGSGTSGSNRDAAERARQDLRKRITDQDNSLTKLRKKRDNVRSKINPIENKLNRAQAQSENMGTARGMSTMRDIDDCERELDRISNQKERISDTQDDHIDPVIEEIENDLEEVNDGIGSGLDEASRISRGVDSIGIDGANIDAELKEIERAKEEAIALKRRISCERILAEHYNKNKSRGEPKIDIDDLKDEIDNINEFLKELQELTGKLNSETEDFKGIIDLIHEKAGKLSKAAKKVKELLELTESISTVLAGLSEDATLEERTAAFGQVISLTGDLASRAPGVGEMISFYAKAYQTAIMGIYAIRDNLIQERVLDAQWFINNRIGCETLINNANDKSLDELVDYMYDRFVNGFVGSESDLRRGLRGQSNLEKFKEMFKAEAMQYIVECCIFR